MLPPGSDIYLTDSGLGPSLPYTREEVRTVARIRQPVPFYR